LITCPAAEGPSCPWSKMSRVEATFSESRKRVVTRRSAGKAVKSRGLLMYMDMRRMASATVKERESRKSMR